MFEAEPALIVGQTSEQGPVDAVMSEFNEGLPAASYAWMLKTCDVPHGRGLNVQLVFWVVPTWALSTKTTYPDTPVSSMEALQATATLVGG